MKGLIVFEKTYHLIRRLLEDELGIKWESIPVSSEAARSKAKAERLPFGSKVKLGPAERERYTTAKKILAAVLGMPHEGWGLYGRSISARAKRMLADPKAKARVLKRVQRVLKVMGKK
jgi:hypothetical protein